MQASRIPARCGRRFGHASLLRQPFASVLTASWPAQENDGDRSTQSASIGNHRYFTSVSTHFNTESHRRVSPRSLGFRRGSANTDCRRHFASNKKGRHRNRPGYNPDQKGGKKESFVSKFIEPASRGELKKGHKTGIPRLAARKGKGNLKEDEWSTTKRANRGRDWPKFEADGRATGSEPPGEQVDEGGDEPPADTPEKVRKAMEGLTPSDFTEDDMAELREEMVKHGMGRDVEKSELLEVAQAMAKDIGSKKPKSAQGQKGEAAGGGGRGGGIQVPPSASEGAGSEEDSRYPAHWDEAVKQEKFFAEELWDDNKYWWNEEDHDSNLFVDKDFNLEDYTNDDGMLVNEYDKDLKENPIFHSLLQDEQFHFDHQTVLDFYKKHAPPEEVEKLKGFDWSKHLVRGDDKGEIELAEDERLLDFEKMGDMDYSELFPDDEDGPPDLNDDFFEHNREGSRQAEEDDENYSYIEDKFGMPRGRQRLIDAAMNMEEPEKDPEEYYYNGQYNVLDIVKRPDSDFLEEGAKPDPRLDEISTMPPILGEGGVLDFVTAVQDAPTNLVYYEDLKVHPNEKREPRPLFVDSEAEYMEKVGDDPSPALLESWKRLAVKAPPQEFLDSFNRFLYVTSLPPFMADKDMPADLENAEHASRFEKFVANLCGVDSTQVSAANATSAFVGFTAPREYADAIKNGPKNREILVPAPSVKLYDGSMEGDSDDLKQFVEESPSPESILHLQGLRLSNNHSNAELAAALLREHVDKELFEEHGGHILAENVYIVPSSGSALVRFDSQEQAESMLKSELFQERLKGMATYTVQYLRARRELSHKGWDRMTKNEIRFQGPRLAVDGIHMPQRLFYISHASALQIGQVPEGISKRALTEIFQPFCERPRGVEGSIEFATCELSGEPIRGGPVFVGFDEDFEAKFCMEKLGDLKIAGHSTALRLCRDRGIPNMNTTPHMRRTRSVDELNDEMNNWQKYVKEEDIQFLDENGAPRVVLDEVFRGMRRTNNYFGVLNGANPEESIEPERAGKLWEDLVVTYIKLLKECVVTKENPGRMYLEQHYPGQPIDLSPFDKYEIEKEEMERIRKVLNSSTNTVSD